MSTFEIILASYLGGGILLTAIMRTTCGAPPRRMTYIKFVALWPYIVANCAIQATREVFGQVQSRR